MITKVGALRHLSVGAAGLAAPALTMLGFVGGGTHEERFEAKQVVVSPVGGDAARVREVIDHDFGSTDRHGYQRIIPHDFGLPTDVEASSPDAPDDLNVSPSSVQTTIRIGDPNVTIDGQHRYVLEYTLPLAQLTSGELALDIIGNDETLETGRFEVILTGFELSEARCNVGGFGDSGGCQFEEFDGGYRAVISPLEPGRGITVGGPIAAIVEPERIATPSIPDRRQDNHVPVAIGSLAAGALGGFGSFAVARRTGRNAVAGSGADAAFARNRGTATGATPGADSAAPVLANAPVRMVPDGEMGDLATIEFVPPADLRPWQATMLLRERIDAYSIGAVISDWIALEYLAVDGEDGAQRLIAGPKRGEAPTIDMGQISSVLTNGPVTLGTYSPALARAWQEIAAQQLTASKSSGWWLRNGPHESQRYPRGLGLMLGAGVAILVLAKFVGALGWWPMAVLGGLVVTGGVAYAAYRPLLASRSVEGSALALRAESFRRFLQASEGKHAQWAYEHGLLRQYSAWAVALGAADAWQRAVATAAIPPAAAQATAPIIIPRPDLIDRTRTKPAPAGTGGSSSGGGFSSGSVGGGGGGGSSGSW